MKASPRPLFGWTLAIALGAALSSPPSALADPKRVPRGDLPDAARATLNRHTRDAREVVYYADDNAYWANYTVHSGLRLETRVRYNGDLVETSPTKHQPVLSKDQVKVEFQKYRDERRRRGDDKDPRDEARERQIRRLKEAESRGADLRDFRDFGQVSTVFNAVSYQRLDFWNLPREVRRALEAERVDPAADRVAAPRYYRAERNGGTYYGAHYTNRDGRRLEITVSETGRVLDRVDLVDRLVARDRDWRDVGRWDADDLRDRDYDRDRYTPGRDWVGDPADERALLYRRVRFDDLPRDVRDTMTRFTRDAEDLFYQQQRREGRTYYSVHYTPRDGRRVYVRLDEHGHVVRGPELSEYQPRYARGE